MIGYRRCSALALCAVLLIGCATREVYVAHVDAFAEAAKEMSKNAAVELGQYRTNLRLLRFRTALTEVIVRDVQLLSFIGTTDVDLLAEMLCEPRVRFVTARASLQHIEGVSSSLQAVAAPPKSDLKDLIQSLGKDYSIAVKAAPSALDVGRGCRKDLEDYVATVYPLQAEQPEALELLSAAKALYDVLKEIVAPLATRALVEVDSYRRARAIDRYFEDKGNRDRLAGSIQQLSKLLADAETRRRHMSVASFIVAVSEFSNVGVSCTARGRDRKQPEFQGCYKKIWTAWEPRVIQVLSVAADYDQAADQEHGIAGAKLGNVVKDLHGLAEGRVSEETVKALFATATRVLTLAEDVRTAATSEENRKKVTEALAKVKQALGN
jgi:hypothetical protein